jgi:hypothetical protein
MRAVQRTRKERENEKNGARAKHQLMKKRKSLKKREEIDIKNSTFILYARVS